MTVVPNRVVSGAHVGLRIAEVDSSLPHVFHLRTPFEFVLRFEEQINAAVVRFLILFNAYSLEPPAHARTRNDGCGKGSDPAAGVARTMHGHIRRERSRIQGRNAGPRLCGPRGVSRIYADRPSLRRIPSLSWLDHTDYGHNNKTTWTLVPSDDTRSHNSYGSVRLFIRKIWLADRSGKIEEKTCAYIGSMFVPLRYRGQGNSAKLLNGLLALLLSRSLAPPLDNLCLIYGRSEPGLEAVCGLRNFQSILH